MLKAIGRDAVRLAILGALAVPTACSFRAEFSASLECDGTRCKLSAQAVIFKPEEAAAVQPGPDEVVLPASLASAKKIEPGSILVSEDFIRKVTSINVDGDTAHAATTEATLAEVVEKGETSTPEGGIDLADDSNVRATWTALTPKAEWTTSGRFQYRDTTEFVALSGARVALDYEFSLRPRLEAGLSFGFFSLKHAHAILGADMRAIVNVVGSFKLEKNKRYSVVLWRSPEFQVALPPIGPVPVTFRSQLVLRAFVTVDANSEVVVRTGFDLMAAGRYGYEYDSDSGLRTVKSWNTDGSSITPPVMTAAAALRVRGGVRAELDAGLFGGCGWLSAGAGVRLWAEPFAELTVASGTSGTTWQARAAWMGGADVRLEALGETLAEKSYPFFKDGEEPVFAKWPAAGTSSPVVTPCSSSSTSALAITCGKYTGCTSLCPIGGKCLKADDCASGRCAGGVCASTKPTVAIGGACAADLDCIEGVCTTEPGGDGRLARFCRPLHCSNETSSEPDDVGETSVDCGGAASGCRRCGPYQRCNEDGDCRSGLKCLRGIVSWCSKR